MIRLFSYSCFAVFSHWKSARAAPECKQPIHIEVARARLINRRCGAYQLFFYCSTPSTLTWRNHDEARDLITMLYSLFSKMRGLISPHGLNNLPLSRPLNALIIPDFLPTVMKSLESKSTHKSLSERALQYTAVLNGRVDRDTTRRPLVGESADVYEGTLQPEGIKVAVKTIHAYPPDTQETIEHFLREVHLWSSLRQKNIQPLLGISTDFNMTVSLIHPWMEKGNAFDYVQNKSVDPRPLLLGIANGLHYLHSHGSGPISHGSLRGSNVLISDDGEARLIDFGVTSLVNSTFGLPISTARIGALNWTAPECLEECEPALEQDIWSYGMTALELFTREPPFHDKPTIRVLMQRIMEGPPDRPSARSTYSRLTDGWWEICMLCWRRDPSARPGITDIVAKIAAESEKRM